MCLAAKNYGLQEENINIFKHKLGKRDGVPQREKEGGRMQCFMKRRIKACIDVENVETTGERCCHLS